MSEKKDIREFSIAESIKHFVLSGWLRDLFFCSKAPGLVFSTTSQRGILAPSAFPSTDSGLRFPPLIRREKDSGLPPVTAEKTSQPSYTVLGLVRQERQYPLVGTREGCKHGLFFVYWVSRNSRMLGYESAENRVIPVNFRIAMLFDSRLRGER